MAHTIYKAAFPAIITITLCAMSIAPRAIAQEAGPKYKAEVPQSILTPDTVKTKLLGNLEFFDGMPSKTTVHKSYDFIDTARGTEAFLSGIPAASVYAILEGFKRVGMQPGDMGITENLMDARSLYLTPQLYDALLHDGAER
jgi:hypothetical protein